MNQSDRTAEHIERLELQEFYAAATPAVRDKLGFAQHKIGNALVSIASKEPSILLNRCIGLGVDGADTEQTVRDIVAAYREAGVERYFVHLHRDAQPAGLRDMLLANGLEKSRGWMKFKRDTSPPVGRSSDLEVRRVDHRHAEDFGCIAAASFGLSEAIVPAIGALVERPGWYLYMSFDGDRPAGTGSLFVRDGVGWLSWGATDSAYRGRGGQGRVLYQRVKDAIEMGCRQLFTSTGEAVPGDPQHSYKNILRAGFETVAVRDNYEPNKYIKK